MKSEPDSRLFAEYLGGATDERTAGRVLDVVRADRAAMDRLLGLHEVDLMFDVLARTEREREVFADRVMACVVDDARREKICDAVDAEIRRAEPGRRTRQRRPVALPVSRPSAWGWRITGIAAALLVGLGVLLVREFSGLSLGLGRGALARVEQIDGVARRVRDESAAMLRVGDGVRAGDTVYVGAGAARVTFACPELGRFAVRPGSVLSFRADSRTTGGAAGEQAEHFHLERGALFADCDRLPAGRRFVLGTPHAHVVVVGTAFEVVVRLGGTEIDLREGRVRLVNLRNGEQAMLEPGSRAVVAKGISVVGRPGTAPGGPRVLYTFSEGRGAIVRDTAGGAQPLDLRVEDPSAVRWLPGGGLHVQAPTRLVSTRSAETFVEACRRSEALTVEAWIRPTRFEHLSSSPARILTFSPDEGVPNCTLGLGLYDDPRPRFVVRMKSTAAGESEFPELLTRPGRASTELTQLVFTRARAGRAALYVNGQEVLELQFHSGRLIMSRWTGELPGMLTNWRDDVRLLLGNVPAERADPFHAFLGEYHRVALYDRAWSAEEVRSSFRAMARMRMKRADGGRDGLPRR